MEGEVDGVRYRIAETEEIRARVTADRVALVAMPHRIGVASFIVFLEHREFPPGTPSNADFDLAVMNWEGIRWWVVIIPRVALEKADKLMTLLGLRRANGVPTILGRNGIFVGVGSTRPNSPNAKDVVARFPLDRPNVFTLENLNGHFAYGNNRDLEQKARAFERDAIEREMATFQRAQDDCQHCEELRVVGPDHRNTRGGSHDEGCPHAR